MAARLSDEVVIFYECCIGLFPNYVAGGKQVGLASMFRDRETSPRLRNESCSRCSVPSNTSYVHWKRNFEEWMGLHLAAIPEQLRTRASRGFPHASRSNGSLPADFAGVAVLDFEAWHPKWELNLESTARAPVHGPCCRFPGSNNGRTCVNNGTGACTDQWRGSTLYHWALFVSSVNAPRFDPDFLDALQPYSPPAGAAGWADLAPCEQLSLLKTSFDHFTREFYTRTFRALQSLRPHAQWGLWSTPTRLYPNASANLLNNACADGCTPADACGYNGPGTDGTQWMRAVNDELGWLWQLSGALLPALYPSGWVEEGAGPAPCGPTGLPRLIPHWSAADNAAYYDDNLREAARLRAAARLGARPLVLPYFWWHFTSLAGSCGATFASRANKSMPFVGATSVGQFFSAAATFADGAILWGDGQDAYSSQPYVPSQAAVAAALERELAGWEAPVVRYCSAR